MELEQEFGYNDHEISRVALSFKNSKRVDVDDKDALLGAICRFKVSGRGDVSELRK